MGHAFSALTAFEASRGGEFLIRIEDIDVARSKPHFEAAIIEDLEWLNLTWHGPVMRQSERMACYDEALAKLVDMGLCYPCSCTRKDIETALSAPQEGAEMGPDGIVYPGTCRNRHMDTRGPGDAVRLNISRAVDLIRQPLNYRELGENKGDHTILPQDLVRGAGDIVLARKDIGTCYHMAVVVDDAAQEITHITRGKDMQSATPVHVLLQKLLGLPTPIYRHHRLIRDRTGKRLAKRHDALAIRVLREQGKTPEDIRAMVGL